MNREAEDLLRRIFQAGLRAVEPRRAVTSHVSRQEERLKAGNRTYDLKTFDRVFLTGAGKGGAPMARAVEELLGDRLTEGRIVVPYGHGAALEKTRVYEAGHPVPDEAGWRAAREILQWLGQAGEKDLVICALSGGGSALLPAPAPPVTLEQKQATTRALLECGATIHEINALRKHLSLIKGGGLARAAWPATVLSLILSDVAGDSPEVVASGPAAPDGSRFRDCLEIVRRYELGDRLPPQVVDRLRRGAEGSIPETPEPDDPVFQRVQNVVVGNNRMALLAARDEAASLGLATLVLSSTIQGEAREVARVLAAVGRETVASGLPLAPPACILAGGETTVTLRGPGKGGRNQELALGAALELDGCQGVALLSAGTDGTDGPTDAAGAMVDGSTCARAREKGLDPRDFLQRNDAYSFFRQTGGLLKTGPTFTNVMDVILVLASEEPMSNP